MGKGTATAVWDDKSVDKAVWDDRSVDKFCDLCIIEVDNDNRPHTHFNKEGWDNLVRNFTSETERNYSRKQLKNKWDSLKEQWKLWKELKGKETGLGWDYNKQTVDASDEWWKGKIQKNAEYANLRKKGIPPALEEKLDRLFGSVSATGKHAWTPSSSLPLPRSPKGSIVEEMAEVIADSVDVAETEQGKKRKSQSTGSVGTKKGKVGGAAKLSQQIDRMCTAFENKSTASSMITKKLQEDETTSIKETMKLVRSLPGVGTTTPLWHFATDLLLSKDMREMFATMQDDPEGMKSWLIYQMNKK